MNKLKLLLLCGCLFCLNSISYALTDIVQGELLISLSSGVELNEVLGNVKVQDKSALKLVYEAIELSPNLRLYQLRTHLGLNDLNVLKQKLSRLRSVRYVQYNHLASLRGVPNDGEFTDQWDMTLIGAEQAWDITTGEGNLNGETLVIGIIDAGVDHSHFDIAPNLWENSAEIAGNGIDDDANGFVDDYLGWNFNNGSDTHFPTPHGTSVAGIMIGRGNDNYGIAGLNWGCKLMAFSEGFQESQVVLAYQYMYEQKMLYMNTNGAEGAFVVASNASFGVDGGNPANFQAWCEMFDLLGSVGILSVAATANKDYDVDVVGDIPTACSSPYLIAVTNTDKFDRKEQMAAVGLISIDLSAPGTGCYTTKPQNTFGLFGGTSGAAPHVTGAVALLSHFPFSGFVDLQKNDPAQAALFVKDAILSSVDPLSELNGVTVSGGRLNVSRALSWVGDYFSIPEDLELVSIFPNPTESELTLRINFDKVGDYSVQFWNTLGQKVLDDQVITIDELGQRTPSINVEHLNPGVYIMQLKNGDRKLSRRFIKQ